MFCEHKEFIPNTFEKYFSQVFRRVQYVLLTTALAFQLNSKLSRDRAFESKSLHCILATYIVNSSWFIRSLEKI